MFSFNGTLNFPTSLLVGSDADQIDVISDPPVIELWDAWAFAEVDAELALRRWFDAPITEREPLSAAYAAALAREEQAAKALQMRLAVSAPGARWS
jgi:hypothetical protein